MTVIYAVGDIHGRIDLLEDLLDHIHDHHALLHADEAGEVIFLGDYVDPGPGSIAVIDRLMSGIEGNHEAMMLNCLDTDNRQVW